VSGLKLSGGTTGYAKRPERRRVKNVLSVSFYWVLILYYLDANSLKAKSLIKG
jgi:hypothetical protein